MQLGFPRTGPYRIPNVKIDSVCVYTNLPPSGPYRGFGYSEFHFGLESHMTRMAQKLGMDPVEFRRKNAIREGDTLAYGAKMNPCGLQESIDRVAAEIGWGKKEVSKDPNKVIGKGFACYWKAPAMPPNAASAAFMKFNEDGSLNISVSGMEIGQGFLTVMAQIAAEILTVPIKKIRVELPDTDRNAYEWQTVGSHVTWGCGNAVKAAALDLRGKMFDVVERAHGLSRDSLYLENERVKCRERADFELPLRDFVINGIQLKHGNFIGGPILGSGMFMPEFTSALSDPETSQGGHPNVHYTVGAAAVTLEIDKKTGKMRVLKAALAVDAGQGDQSEPRQRPDCRRGRSGVGDGVVRRHPFRPEGQIGQCQLHGLQDSNLDGCAGRNRSDYCGGAATRWPVRRPRDRRTHNDSLRRHGGQRGGRRAWPSNEDHADNGRESGVGVTEHPLR